MFQCPKLLIFSPVDPCSRLSFLDKSYYLTQVLVALLGQDNDILYFKANKYRRPSNNL